MPWDHLFCRRCTVQAEGSFKRNHDTITATCPQCGATEQIDSLHIETSLKFGDSFHAELFQLGPT